MQIKIVNLCPVCGGRGKFLTQVCPSCKGKVANLIKFNPQISTLFEQKRHLLSEQEIAIFELYRSGFTQRDIAQKADMTLSQSSLALYRIEQKLNREVVD